MDSEHRHELKKNELADGLSHPSEFYHKHKSWFLAIIIVLLVMAGWKMPGIVSNMIGKSRLAKDADATMLIQRALAERGNTAGGSLQGMAVQLGQAAVDYEGSAAAMLLIQKGNTLRADIHYTAAGMDQSTIEARIEEARNAYQQAITEAAGSINEKQLVANARIGLGLCHEELGEYDEAAAIYKEIIRDETLKSTVFVKKAQMRLDSLDDNQGMYVFVDAPEPVEEQETAPLPVNPDAMLQDVLKNAPIDDTEAETDSKDDQPKESEEPK